jgi:alkanesulfonate monooxygenase SsuD/methylene tetrahydromethanopterin reductase-like flavin-dependent oxidoreductase (luciferase family)
MLLGLELPTPPPPASSATALARRDALVEVVRAVEEGGFSTLWFADGVADDRGPACDTAGLAAGMVPYTRSLRLGIRTRLHPGRAPSILAREVTALDLVSGGRTAVAVGLGLAQGNGPDGAAELCEAVAVCHALFTEPSPTFHGRHFQIDEAANRPGPVTAGGPPLLIDLGDRPADVVSADTAACLGLVTACLTGGGPDEVVALRRALDGLGAGRDAGGSPVLWRGRLGPEPGVMATQAAGLLAAGADGLIVQTTDVEADGRLAAWVSVLAPLVTASR